ncbi:hypothetical protein Vau01_035860 [Virgisporangium aurantiacum]|uniref:Uncharacterized protein n=1 Tax=Virgisporangium aurantiacum TaxID=175570 RepID=A0A8J3Z6D8_9ACTN|nr:hypothetical protein Vau01_035860 [Virgisporangium aurantiacum]
MWGRDNWRRAPPNALLFIGSATKAESASNPNLRLSNAIHRPGDGVVIGFDKIDHPVEAVDDGFCQPEDSAIIFPGVRTARPQRPGAHRIEASRRRVSMCRG